MHLSLNIMLLQIAVLSDVLEDNGMDMDAILDAHMGGDASEEEEEEEGMGPAAAEGPNVEGELRISPLKVLDSMACVLCMLAWAWCRRQPYSNFTLSSVSLLMLADVP